MNRNDLFPTYVESPSAADALRNAREFVNAASAGAGATGRRRRRKLVSPVLAPRFALACDRELMRGLADLAAEKGLRVHSHLAENEDEVRQVRKAFGGGVRGGAAPLSYAGVYDEAGLLGPRTAMAHCVHLDEAEIK